MERIKVIEYISNLGDGGAETLVKDYVRLIDRKQFDPVVVIMKGGEESANRRILEENNIPVYEIFSHWDFCVRIFKKALGWWYIPFKLRKIIRKEKAQVMHMHLIVLKDLPRVGKALRDLRLFFTCHSTPDVAFSKDLAVERKAAMHLIHNENMQLIALHNEMAKQLNEMFLVENTVVIRNGIDFKKFLNSGMTADIEREKLGIPKDAFVIGHVGRFSKEKNHAFLVDVFFEVARDHANSFLLMVGAGNTEVIEEKLKSNGFDNRYLILSHRTDVNEIMRVMDVFVFPSIYEGLGIALIEAQVSGLRCIASDNVPADAFRTENAIALPLGNPEKWANAVLDRSIKGCSHGTLDEYDMNKEIRRLEKLYLGETLS